jgi:glycosyltransferase involved in cell wall biosynthesis
LIKKIKNKSNIIITIIITNFNKDKYLRDCLKSIITQKLEEIEIILIDDNSNDNSKKILKDIIREYKKKIKVIYNRKNLGPSRCRNIGIKQAKGSYIAFVDSDDKIYTTFKILINCLKKQKNNNQLIILKYISSNKTLNNNNLFIDKNKKLNEYSTDFYLQKKIKFLTQHESIWYILYLKSYLKENKISFLKESDCLEDLDFVTKSISLSKNIALLNKKYYYYRELKSSLKKNYSKKRALGAMCVYKSLIYFIKKEKLSSVKKKLLNYRIKFVKNIFLMRYFLLKKKNILLNNMNIENNINLIKKRIIKNFSIKLKDKIAIYCYGPSGKFLYEILKEANIKDLIFIDDKISFLNKTNIEHKIYNFNKKLLKNYKIIIANPKEYIVSNIKKKNPKFNMYNFNINEI